MRSLLLLSFLLTMSTLCLAQPINDNCSGLIDLGVTPACPPDIFTNVGATTSNIGFGNNPSCFNGGGTQRDVWFAFTTTVDLTDLSITLIGVNTGPNGTAIMNPQIALYRGDCEVDGLAELSCISSEAGSAQVQLDILGLTPGVTYFLRINDYSATAAPNSGDFTLCIDEYVPAINIGSSPGTTACFGTLYDSGGPDDDYLNNENHTFTICPNDFHSCIELNLESFNTEAGFDFIRIFAGPDINSPRITNTSGTSNGQPFPIQVTSDCVTIQFVSDGSSVGDGFELTWQCTPLECGGNNPSNPTVINNVPFTQNGVTTCSGAVTFGNSPCNNTPFINGPQYVYAYNSPGGLCASVILSGASAGTGVLVLSGLPGAPGTVCVAQSNTGNISSANFETPGTYYIVVANAAGCTNFNISIQETECILQPSLVNALCNPFNGCLADGVPTEFEFEDGFQDIPLTIGTNNGCWGGVGAQSDYVWFTIQAQADGPLGFIFNGTNFASDIDYNVWGPFTQQQACENPAVIIDAVTNTQPIRSSYAGLAVRTGLTDVHPTLGYAITDTYDCQGVGNQFNDQFVSAIQCQEGEVYVVLVNDFGNNITDGSISIDFNPSDPAVLTPLPAAIIAGDTAVCSGESVQIAVESPINSIEWIGGNSDELSCLNCFTPIATPTETTIYKALIDAVCYTDTVLVTVRVFDLDAGPDLTVCRGEEIQIQSGESYNNATYTWQVPAGLQFSCTDCPSPFVTGAVAGTYNLVVSLDAAGCDLQDVMTLTVLPIDAAQYTISDNLQICEGTTVNLGGTAVAGVTYNWTSAPDGLTSMASDPQVTPTQTTTYYLTAQNAACPVPSLDSVLVEVFTNPIIEVVSDTAVCQSSQIVLGATTPEPGTSYLWSGPATIVDPTDPNTSASPEAAGTYTLTATRAICTTVASFDVTITPIAIAIQQAEPIRICQGELVTLNANVTPANAQAVWTPNNGSLNTNIGNTVIAQPQTFTQYIARVDVPGCFKTDTIEIVVDSLPSALLVMPPDTMICQGNPVVLVTPTYDPSDFMGISFKWMPNAFAETSDTLLNFVVTPDTTITYSRITTNGVCVDTVSALITVNPIPIATIVPADTIVCAGNPVQLAASFSVEVDEISWTPETGLSCADCPGPVAVLGESTLVTVVGTRNGCSGAASANIEVLPLPSIILNTQRIICFGDAITLDFDPDPNIDYTWTSTDPSFVQNPNGSQVVSPTSTATYTVNATNDGCTNTGSITIEVVQDVTLDVTASVDGVCAGTPVTLTASVSQSSTGEAFRWTSANGQSSNDAVFSLTPGQTDTYYLEYTTGNNCQTLYDTVTVVVFPNTIVNLVLDSTNIDNNALPLGQEVGLTAIITNQSPSTPTIVWTGTGPIVSTDGDHAVVQPIENGTLYIVTVTTPEGCLASDTISFNVTPPMVEVPKAFTPNNDDRNDVFKILYSGLIKEVVQFDIYNRWGQKVFETKGLDGWDGTQKGEAAPSDVYIYNIVVRRFDDIEVRLKGDVTLLR